MLIEVRPPLCPDIIPRYAPALWDPIIIAISLSTPGNPDVTEIVCEKRGVYPKSALTIMRIWALIFAFVGIQMAWNLRPFLGDRDSEFTVFRDYEGNFYTAIPYSISQIFKTDGSDSGNPEDRGGANR